MFSLNNNNLFILLRIHLPPLKNTHSLSLFIFFWSILSPSLQPYHLLSISKILCLLRSSIARALSKGKSPKAFASISGNKTGRHHHKQWLLPSPSLSTLVFYFRFYVGLGIGVSYTKKLYKQISKLMIALHSMKIDEN